MQYICSVRAVKGTIAGDRRGGVAVVGAVLAGGWCVSSAPSAMCQAVERGPAGSGLGPQGAHVAFALEQLSS